MLFHTSFEAFEVRGIISQTPWVREGWGVDLDVFDTNRDMPWASDVGTHLYPFYLNVKFTLILKTDNGTYIKAENSFAHMFSYKRISIIGCCDSNINVFQFIKWPSCTNNTRTCVVKNNRIGTVRQRTDSIYL